MTSLVAQIKTDRMSAKKAKNRDVSTLLTTLLGELETIAKREQRDISDSAVVQTCKKFISGNNETILLSFDQPYIDALKVENTILESYLPTQLSESDIKEAITESGASSMKEAFQFLSKNYSGQYDGKLASAIARKMFA